MFEFDPDGRLRALSVAGTAVHAGGEWTLHSVRGTDFASDRATSVESASVAWQSRLDPGLLATSIVQLQYLTLRDLGRNIEYLQRNGQDASAFRGAWWARAFYPIDVLVLAFCAVPFAFGALRSGGLSMARADARTLSYRRVEGALRLLARPSLP